MARRQRSQNTDSGPVAPNPGVYVQEQVLGAAGARGRSKYGNNATWFNGRRYASMAEAYRASDLQLLERAGEISELEYQPRYVFEANGVRICTYRPDFQYHVWDASLGCKRLIVEDVKGTRTQVYQIKRRMMRAFYGIEIQEIQV